MAAARWRWSDGGVSSGTGGGMAALQNRLWAKQGTTAALTVQLGQSRGEPNPQGWYLLTYFLTFVKCVCVAFVAVAGRRYT